MKTLIIEIRAAEGGDDAKLLVLEQFKVYERFAALERLSLELLDARPGFLVFRLQGPNEVMNTFTENESGGMRWQRVPPTEKRGRKQSSTVTVAILEEPKAHEVQIDPRDLEESFTRGSGKGGQHRNKTDTCVILKHLPTGIQVRVDGGRSQHLNRETALGVLRARLKEAGTERATKDRNARRRNQVGSGMRGDKVRTVALQRDTVTDHQTGRSTSAKSYLRGNLRELW
jgi:peptide chain release factor 1